MSISEEARKTLRQIGLTSYETRAYLALIESGVMTASQVSERSDVPYSKIYETLNSLQRKGWIETKKGRPTRYYPKAPSEAFQATRLRLEENMRLWNQAVIEELQPLYERREFREKPDIWILRGESSVLAKLQEMLDGARKELMVAAPGFARVFMDAGVPALNRLQSGGVDIRVMVSGGWNVEELRGVGELRVRDGMFGGGIIVDGREALLLLGEEKPTLVIWSNHVGLVQFAKDYFQHLWRTAEGL
ncbi:MAG: BlaI/MecI/CopY family transcriptional regulator [Candidatus Bathyarchaeota archaeon]|nr:BlaI/MecI/CopY family transcriptional regulator [Candidatus Bathyarchaeota archaeon]